MPTLTLTMICKDEAQNLVGCLDSVRDLVDEIVVVDTGSTDGTQDLARQLGARVFTMAWPDSFAQARNESLDHATGDWVFWLDADEMLDAENSRRLRTLRGRLGSEPAAFFMRQESSLADGRITVDQLRLFPRHPDIRWQYRVHEQVLPAIARCGIRAHRTNLVIHHAGYAEPQVRQAKLQRNHRLLELEIEDNPGDPYVLFNLGWACHELGQSSEARRWLQSSIASVQPTDPFLPKLYALAALVSARIGQTAEAHALCEKGLEIRPDHPELLWQQGLLHQDAGNHELARACWIRLLQLTDNSTTLGTDLDHFRAGARASLASPRQW